MSRPELPTFLNRKIDALLSAFPTWRFERQVIEDDLDENLPTRVCYASKSNGLQVVCDAADTVKVIFAYSSGHEGFVAYRDAVAGVELAWDRQRVRARLGVPSKTTEAQTLPVLGTYGPSDRYDFPSHSVHFQFHPIDPRVDLITIMSPDSVPT